MGSDNWIINIIVLSYPQIAQATNTKAIPKHFVNIVKRISLAILYEKSTFSKVFTPIL